MKQCGLDSFISIFKHPLFFFSYADAVADEVNDTVNVPTQASVPVQLIFGWIIWMRRIGNSFNWQLKWSSYKTGFGSFDGDNFWLGLERMHLLTSSSRYRLRVEFQFSDQWFSVEYWSFAIGGEMTTQYRLTVDGSVQ